jgi:hypothetical protein
MALEDLFTRKTIAGKSIYIVDDHHKALAAWAIERRRLGSPPNLLTIDHHTDVYEAFLGHATYEGSDNPDADVEGLRLDLLARLDWASDDSLLSAIELLQHDEHINAGTMSGVLGSAFCIQLSDSGGTQSVEEREHERQVAESFRIGAPSSPPPQRPMTYEPASDRIYVISFDCAIGCRKRPYDEECAVHHATEVIETRYLDDQLIRGAEIARCLGMVDLESASYILDIDLDAFHTKRAIEPEDPATFYRLIRNAVAITIATEAECVDDLWLDDDCALDSNDLLGKVIAHIDAALAEHALSPE